jgi:hypothetical protein
MDENVAMTAWLKRWRQAHMAESHIGNPRECPRPGVERAGDKRMEVIDIRGNPILVR